MKRNRLPPEMMSEATGEGTLPEVTADCLSKSSFTTAGSFRKIQFSQPIRI